MQATYDGLGRCVRRTVNGTTALFVYDGWNPIVEFDGAGNYRAWNLYGAKTDELLARWMFGVGNCWYHSDRHGNVFALLNDSGAVEERYTYDAFGKPTVSDWWGNLHVDVNNNPQSSYGNRFTFQGREWIAELGIYDYRHRIYHPGLGRFLQVDPTGFDAGDMNLFRYCGDDPVDGSDPEGLQENKPGSTIEERERLFYGDGLGQTSLQELDSRGGLRSIPREQAEKEMSPSRPLSESQRAQLDNGCNGFTSIFQGKGEAWPENAPGTKAYLDQPRAHERVVGDNQRNFVFAKQGEWRTTRPKADPKTGEVPRNSITSADGRFNYVTYMPGTHSYAGMDQAASRGPQHVWINNVAPGNNSRYPHTVWFSTPIDNQ